MDISAIEKLQKFGLNQYEAKAYVALLKTGTANAYAICKESGIPRARIYDVMESITNRGLAMIEESSESVKCYTPVPSKVFMDRIRTEWESDYKDVKNNLNELETLDKKQDIYVLTVKGTKNILAYCRQMIKGAEHHVIVSVWNQMYEQLFSELTNCQERGCKIVGIGHEIKNPMEGIEQHCDNKLHNTKEEIPWFILSVDSRKLLYGYSAESNKDAFYTEDSTHIYLMEEYMLHDIIINRLIKEEEMKNQLSTMMEDLLNELK